MPDVRKAAIYEKRVTMEYGSHWCDKKQGLRPCWLKLVIRFFESWEASHDIYSIGRFSSDATVKSDIIREDLFNTPKSMSDIWSILLRWTGPYRDHEAKIQNFPSFSAYTVDQIVLKALLRILTYRQTCSA